LRSVRAAVSKQECQVNGWTLYEGTEQTAVTANASRQYHIYRASVVGCDNVGRAVCLLWLRGQVVLEVCALLDRVLRKHFIKLAR
jgi:hypothetical protein